MPKILSHTAGRIRLRSREWNRANFEIFAEKLNGISGIEKIQTNLQTQSVLIFYLPNDPKIFPQILKIAEILESAESKKSPAKLAKSAAPAKPLKPSRTAAFKKQKYRARVNLALLSTLGASLFALTTQNTKLHALAGTGFAAVLLLHLFEHRRTLKKQILKF